MLIIVCDIDGTISDSRHRESFARSGDWDKFHSLASLDDPYVDIRELLEAATFEGRLLVYLTGRPETYRRETMEWLENHEFPAPIDLIMRSASDRRSDVDIKPEKLARFLVHQGISKENRSQFQIIILEDRDRMVKRWRELGYTCLQVRDGGY